MKHCLKCGGAFKASMKICQGILKCHDCEIWRCPSCQQFSGVTKRQKQNMKEAKECYRRLYG